MTKPAYIKSLPVLNDKKGSWYYQLLLKQFGKEKADEIYQEHKSKIKGKQTQWTK